MARGKHRRRAALQRVAVATVDVERAQATLTEEREKEREATERANEVADLMFEVQMLHLLRDNEVAEQEAALRDEIHALAPEVAELERLVEKDIDRRGRQINRVVPSGSVAAIEATLAKVGHEGMTFTNGVVVKRGMTAEAVRAIQRARGLR